MTPARVLHLARVRARPAGVGFDGSLELLPAESKLASMPSITLDISVPLCVWAGPSSVPERSEGTEVSKMAIREGTVFWGVWGGFPPIIGRTGPRA